jgi:hypothetical protein
MTIYFISGPLKLTATEFKQEYHGKINEALEEKDSTFVLGNARGVDTMALHYLLDSGIDPSRITCYQFCHTLQLLLKDNKRLEPLKINTKGMFTSNTARDETMTRVSDKDIAWVRSAAEQRKLYGDKYDPNFVTGTQQNINRRKSKK